MGLPAMCRIEDLLSDVIYVCYAKLCDTIRNVCGSNRFLNFATKKPGERNGNHAQVVIYSAFSKTADKVNKYIYSLNKLKDINFNNHFVKCNLMIHPQKKSKCALKLPRVIISVLFYLSCLYVTYQTSGNVSFIKRF